MFCEEEVVEKDQKKSRRKSLAGSRRNYEQWKGMSHPLHFSLGKWRGIGLCCSPRVPKRLFSSKFTFFTYSGILVFCLCSIQTIGNTDQSLFE